MSGHVGNLTATQENILSEFKESLTDVHRSNFDDYFYLRWLRARNFDKRKSEAMLRKSLLWRKRTGVDTILTDYKAPEIFAKYYATGLLGVDKEGCPVRYFPFKTIDLRGFALSVPNAETVKFLTYLFEEENELMKKQEKKMGKRIEQCAYIIDLEGYTFRQATNRQAVDTLNSEVGVFEANYPERLKVAYFINAPVFFSLILALTSPFLSEATLKKIKVLGKDEHREFFRTIIEPSVLPAFLGGDRTDSDGDPRCKTVINYGGLIPKSYYFAYGHRKFSEEEGVKCLTVDRKSFQLVDVEVSESGSKLLYEVEINNNDIGIGLYYRNVTNSKSNEDLEEILPAERIKCHLVPESCAYMCDKTGTYTVKFDNTYSWITQKRILYKITVIHPSEIGEV